MNVKLIDIAEVIRSKNSGPYELTLDIIFKDWEMFEHVCAVKAVNPRLLPGSTTCLRTRSSILWSSSRQRLSRSRLWRPIASGDLGETDVYGAQQHGPLLGVDLAL